MPLSARTLFDRLVHVETMLWNRCDDELQRQIGLPLGRLEVLRVIAQIQHCRVNDVASRLLITVGAASKLVDRLEASGHCQRHPNPDDRRSSRLSVTDVGQTTLTGSETLMEALLTQAFAAVSFAPLHDALSTIEQTLTTAGEPA
ncbi:MarR family winged helix-turn-helix transcriptional regulator [Deinococcus aquatilis]|uniref:MarR family winged helix-turn-helix transcriptional regulator n=1 Tax=Deinococcus aquatilis TaxID=519440 RepID=UPI000365F399|nr:MarR family winged helix-turn-helix transcriptional regulator [Deinococcus aquatilis]